MKCLPHSKVSQAQGITLHDWHAETLAIRSFNRFLLDECYSLASDQKSTSEYIRLRNLDERTKANFQPFALKDDIALHMYCSEAPCQHYYIPIFERDSNELSGGDASMELTMAAQEDATPWDLPPEATRPSPNATSAANPPLSPGTPIAESSSPALESQLHGRGYFSALGVVRRKPSRPDAPPTLSKSCSDKITLKQCTSLLSSITSLLISPSNAYLSSLILPESQYSVQGCTRAFSVDGRMKQLAGKDWKNGYSFKPFEIRPSSREFRFSRRQIIPAGDKLVPSNISASRTPHHFETLIGGVLQGRKQGDIKGASRVCKRKMWKLALDIAKLVNATVVAECLREGSYMNVKASTLLEERRKVKEDVRSTSLVGWVRNSGGDEFCLENDGG